MSKIIVVYQPKRSKAYRRFRILGTGNGEDITTFMMLVSLPEVLEMSRERVLL
ncbi:MAG TPA: hypothetical protein G4N95_00020 [Anaerolineae bacterium]|nr:hypothetical protein [Anaerolineae bacterium]